MQNFAQLPAILWRMTGDILKSALISAAIPVALAGALLAAVILLLSQATGLPLRETAATVFGDVQVPDLTLLYLLAALPLTLAALAVFSQYGLNCYKLLRAPGGCNWLLPSHRWTARIRRLAGRWLLTTQPYCPRRIAPAAALSLAHPHRTVLATAADLSGAAPLLN